MDFAKRDRCTDYLFELLHLSDYQFGNSYFLCSFYYPPGENEPTS
jgi:hypothetical protein